MSSVNKETAEIFLYEKSRTSLNFAQALLAPWLVRLFKHFWKAGSASFFGLKMTRYQELLKMKKKALAELSRAKKAMGQGIWHEDPTYEMADTDIRLWLVRLEEIEKELREIEKSKKK